MQLILPLNSVIKQGNVLQANCDLLLCNIAETLVKLIPKIQKAVVPYGLTNIGHQFQKEVQIVP